MGIFGIWVVGLGSTIVVLDLQLTWVSQGVVIKLRNHLVFLEW